MRVQHSKFLQISSFLLPNWTVLHNYCYARLSRIWIFHKGHIQVTVSTMSCQAIHCHVYNTLSCQYTFLSAIYADPYSEMARMELWNELVLLGQALPAVPWLVGGDFNEIRSLSERSDGLACLPRESVLFNDKLQEAELHDLVSTSSFFTWSNNRCAMPITKKTRYINGE
ncbi:hypothetical protein SLA2020_239810 [Shorea laevis]